jgi:hypothetical protein
VAVEVGRDTEATTAGITHERCNDRLGRGVGWGVDAPFSPVWTRRCWTGVSVRAYKTGDTDLSERGGSVKGLFAHAATVLLLAGTGACAFLLGCAGSGAGVVCAGGADGLRDVRACRRAGVGGGGRRDGRGGHVGEAYGEGVWVVVLREEKGQRVRPVAVRMPAGDRSVAGQRRGHVGRAERRRRRVAVVEGRSVEEARIRIRRSVRRSGVGVGELLRVRLERGELCTAWALHGAAGGWEGLLVRVRLYIRSSLARRQEAVWTASRNLAFNFSGVALKSSSWPAFTSSNARSCVRSHDTRTPSLHRLRTSIVI